MQHILRLSEAGISKLKTLNRKIKIWFKEVLHLPVWTSDAWIYAKSGGNLQDIAATILACRKKATEKMLNSGDATACEVGALLKERVTRDFNRLGVGHVQTNLKDHFQKRHLEKLGEQKGNSSALKTMASSPICRDWIWRSNLKSQEKINCLKLTGDLYPTRINQTKGIYNQKIKKCRKCGVKSETQAHILNACETNKNAISKRHNLVADKVAELLGGEE